jgi:hypothetical protein
MSARKGAFLLISRPPNAKVQLCAKGYDTD